MKIILKKVSKKKASWQIIDSCCNIIERLSRTKKRIWIIKKVKEFYPVYHKQKIIAIACIKNTSQKYRNYIIQKTWISKLPNYEFGYCYVTPKYRGYGISTKLLLVHKKSIIFVTTTENNIPMQKTLKKCSFKKKWKPFKSKLWNYNIFLFTNLTK